ncbi:MAG: bifunctional folylpolyglutamate synthase/dihydrofolate synthase [Planctomycetes bacterium]|nr:bifunctional folylpolyglutamate synthase/dihydrofolate synthase [Planctomycetota bacterium]
MAKIEKNTSKDRTQSPPSKIATVKTKKAFSRYKQALAYLLSKTDYEQQEKLRYNVTTFNLDRMRTLLTLLGNPHTKTATAHIAGSKGKGSTATMLAKMLESNGFKVGLYTSPHLIHLHERIRVNSVMISDSEMLRLLNRAHAAIEKLAEKDPPTFFEILTALAFMHFADKKADIAIIETGMGGRLDSTNVITPEVIGITSLSIDHQQQLGSTIDSIAREKAGVFKKGVPVLTVEQEPSAMQVLKSEALAVQSPFSVTGEDIDFSYRFETSREDGPHTRICLTTETSKFEHLRVPLYGKHQAVNCGLALAMLDKLKASGFEIDTEKATRGLNEVSLMGRMEMVYDDPRIMIDGAHNAASVRALIHAIGQNIPYDSMVIVFGCNSDKDVPGMLEQLQYGADKVIFTRSSSPKAMSPRDLADMYTEICDKMFQTSSSLGEALKIANSAVSREDLICITGSFYLIGQAKTRLQPALQAH